MMRPSDPRVGRSYLAYLTVRREHGPLAIMPEWIGHVLPAPLHSLAELHELGLTRLEAAVPSSVARKPGTVAVIPIRGFIQPRRDIWEEFGFSISCETIGRRTRAALADPDIKAVVYDIDSPGGLIAGVTELAKELRGLRGPKPIVAQANQLAASAAYWIAAQADQVVASPSSLVGAIGVLSVHVEFSKALELAGIKPTIIFAGKRKADGNEFEPLSDAARAERQALVDEHYVQFIADVAAGRGVPGKQVKADYGEGAILSASAALAAGAIDKVRSLPETLVALGVAPAPGPASPTMQPARALAAARRARELQALAENE